MRITIIRDDCVFRQHSGTHSSTIRTANEKVLNVDDNEFQKYCESIVKFWDVLPERMYYDN